MNAVLSSVPESLNERIEEVRKRIERLKGKLRGVDAELEKLAVERERFHLLDGICQALEKLDAQGAGHLFWGERTSPKEAAAHLERVRGAMAGFAEQIAAIEQRHKALEDEIQEQLTQFDSLSEELLEEREREENAKYEFVVSRELVLPAYVPPVMPWSEPPADRRRFRKTLLLALLIAFCVGSLVAVWTLPLPEKADEQKVPERLVELVQRARLIPPPPPPEQKKPEKEEEKPKAKSEEKPKAKSEEKPKVTTPEPQKARAKAEKSGILAFKSSFADLINDTAAQKLGTDARVTQRGEKAVGDTRRNLVVAQAREGSGGINTAAISRNVGGGLGNKVGGVAFTRVESSVGDLQGEDRPLSDSPGPSRTDEEIQIVFDRYKATLYRIYNRELRIDPTLRGKMVLRMTIEPNGEVSFCAIESTDLASAALKTEVVARVKRFNFGPKEGVPRITILYPIDFLPAT
jgi:hypothetical protein